MSGKELLLMAQKFVTVTHTHTHIGNNSSACAS